MTKLPETEQKLELIKPIDQLSIDKSIKLMISEQNKGIDSILPQTNKIKNIIDLSVKHLKSLKKVESFTVVREHQAELEYKMGLNFTQHLGGR